MKDKNTKKEQPSLKDRLAQWKPMPFRDWLKQNWIALVVLAVAAAIFVGMYFYSHQGKIYQNQSTELENLTLPATRPVASPKTELLPAGPSHRCRCSCVLCLHWTQWCPGDMLFILYNP